MSHSPHSPIHSPTTNSDTSLRHNHAHTTYRVRIFQAESAQFLRELQVPNVVDIQFSPRGTYMSTWERPVKFEDGSQHKNLRVFSVSTGEELVAFSQKSQDNWDLQYTISESHAIRLVGQEVQVFRPAEWSKGIVDKLKVEGATSVSLSPGLNPSLAVFVAEKKVRPTFELVKALGEETDDNNVRAPQRTSKYTAFCPSILRPLVRRPSSRPIDHRSSGTPSARRCSFSPKLRWTTRTKATTARPCCTC